MSKTHQGRRFWSLLVRAFVIVSAFGRIWVAGGRWYYPDAPVAWRVYPISLTQPRGPNIIAKVSEFPTSERFVRWTNQTNIAMVPNVDTLVLAPHIDDEVLGCFSFLNERTFVHCFGAEHRSYVSREGRIAELERAAGLKRFHWHVSSHDVNSYRGSSLIPELEARINELRPKTVLIPQPCYNQDHRAVYDAAIVATRPHDRNWLVPTVLLYEQPHVFIWPYGHGGFAPNYFRPIDIAAKLELYEVYASQVRGHRSPALLTALAQLRGAAINVPYAEAFCCQREVHPA